MSAICVDCGMDTTPCTGRRGCRHRGRWEYYVVGEDVWAEAWGRPTYWTLFHPEPTDEFLCVGCLETRLGRPLVADDFPDAGVNTWLGDWDTPRLATAKRREAVP